MPTNLTNLLEEYSKKNFRDILHTDFKSTDIKPANDDEVKKSAIEQLKENDVLDLRYRGQKYSELLDDFINYYYEKNELNFFLKKVFFWFFMIFLSIIIVVIPIGIIVITAIGLIDNSSIITAFSASTLSTVTSIIIIPKIIAKYLFSTKEDAVISDLVKKIQDNDEEIRQLHNK